MLPIVEVDEKPVQCKNCPQQAQGGRKMPTDTAAAVFGKVGT